MQYTYLLKTCKLFINLIDMKESDLSVMHKRVIKVAELLGLEKSYAILSMLERTKNLNGLEQLIE